MLKHEFELLATNGEPIDADLFEDINRDYMRTDDTKLQYVSRVFGTSGKTPDDIAWIFSRYRKQQQQQQQQQAKPKHAAVYVKQELTNLAALLTTFLQPGTLSDGTTYSELHADFEQLRYMLTLTVGRLQTSAAMLESEVIA